MRLTNHQQSQSLAQLKLAVKRAMLIQIALILLSAGMALMINWQVAAALLLGGLISLLPNAYFAVRVLFVRQPLDALVRVRKLFNAEAFKLLLSAVMFALVFSRLPQVPPAFVLGGFLLAHLGYLISLISLQPKSLPTVTTGKTHER